MEPLKITGLLVDEYQKLYGVEDVYALGDCTFTKNPPTAQVASQQGHFLADHFNKLSKLDDLKFLATQEKQPEQIEKLHKKIQRTESTLLPFHYEHQGSLAYIGSERAVADLSLFQWSTVSVGGNLTFLFWRSAYVSMLMGFRNKVLVTTDWIKVAIFGRDCSKDN
ncbi:unnamed protein product [Ambrosiozyma monospora]|uniref:Unnamed protein product n=1 Tax=Ambrosiozyma monospora TaxID=43982 RepID=A0ACB5TT18_AMBMO|nr:unnamed protein product [Ambrosiozyma monospora]